MPNFTSSPAFRLVVVGALTLALQIPVFLINAIAWERDNTRAEAVREIAASWGQNQQIVGPFLVAPYTYETTEVDDKGVSRTRTYSSYATFLPEQLKVVGDLAVERRYRGIFEAPVYTSTLKISGAFDPPDFSRFQISGLNVRWDAAQIVFEINDARAVKNSVALDWGGVTIPFEPGVGVRQAERAGIHAPLSRGITEQTSFSLDLTLAGSQSIRFAPLGRHTDVTLSGNWGDPSFQGAWLPEHDVQTESFRAVWSIPYLGRSYPEEWIGAGDTGKIDQSLFGADLIAPVDAYRQTERSIKYAILFLALTFTVIWLFEALGRARVHFVEYALIGAALCLFYLLELSLGEHLGFKMAYLLAAAPIIALVTAYARPVLGAWTRAMSVGGVIAALYGCLYLILQLEDYALLAGSLLLFAALATIMYLTRNIDWNTAREPM
ncbi:MAG: cell envelope integrity protein CreD [Bryobacterales bacterium]